MNHDVNATDEGEFDAPATEPTKRSRKLIIGTAAGLVIGLTATGVGLAAQSPSSNESPTRAPAGAQLPWDDSMSSDNPLAPRDSNEDSNMNSNDDTDGRAQERRERRAERRGEMRDKMRQHMAGDAMGMSGMRGLPMIREIVSAAADTLGISEMELISEVRSGKSIADIADENDVDVRDVIDALVEQVTRGARDAITDLVERQLPVPQG